MIDAREYARALFLLCEEDGITDKILDELGVVNEALRQNPAYARLLDTPALTKAEKLGLIDEAFRSLDLNLVNFIKILCEKHSVFTLKRVESELSALVDEARGIERATAISAVAMTTEQIDRLRERLEAMIGKTVVLSNKIDPSVLGGIKLRYSGAQLDGTVKGRLDGFAARLSEIVV